MPFITDGCRVARIAFCLDEYTRVAREARRAKELGLEWTALRAISAKDFQTVCGGHMSKTSKSLYRQVVLAQRDWEAFMSARYRIPKREWDSAQERMYFCPYQQYTFGDGTAMGYMSENEELPGIDKFKNVPQYGTKVTAYKVPSALTRISLALKVLRLRLRKPKTSELTQGEYLGAMLPHEFMMSIPVQGPVHRKACDVAEDVASIELLTLLVLARRTFRDFIEDGKTFPSQAILNKCFSSPSGSEPSKERLFSVNSLLFDELMANTLCSEGETEWEDVDGIDGIDGIDGGCSTSTVVEYEGGGSEEIDNA